MRHRELDEDRFDPALEFSTVQSRERIAAEETTPGNEDHPPKPFRETAPEFGGGTSRSPEEDKKRRTPRHALLKRGLLLPVAAVVAVLSIIFASAGYDPLGDDLLIGHTNVPPAAPPAEEPAAPGNEPEEPGPASPEPSEPDSGPTSPVTAPEEDEVYDDAFPALPNLDPDFAGDYAWAGLGSEEYLIVDGQYLHAGTYYTDSGVTLSSVAGASYDSGTNTLTLNNFHGGHIDLNLMGNGFKINLVGENSVDSIRAWGAMYGGSITFSGSGSITINKNRSAEVGITLECEDSPSCLMIDRGVTVEVFGDRAIVIHRTLLDRAIYVLKPIAVTGGELSTGEFVSYTVNVTDENGDPVTDENGDYITEEWTVADIGEYNGLSLYDYSVVDSNGNPAQHVLFSPVS